MQIGAICLVAASQAASFLHVCCIEPMHDGLIISVLLKAIHTYLSSSFLLQMLFFLFSTFVHCCYFFCVSPFVWIRVGIVFVFVFIRLDAFLPSVLGLNAYLNDI